MSWWVGLWKRHKKLIKIVPVAPFASRLPLCPLSWSARTQMDCVAADVERWTGCSADCATKTEHKRHHTDHHKIAEEQSECTSDK